MSFDPPQRIAKAKGFMQLGATFLSYVSGERPRSALLRLLPYLLSLIVLCVLLAGAEKIWLKNDDGLMAMIVHGYGIASTPSPGLAYSNVVWGWLLQHLGPIAGVQAYTWMDYLLLALSLAGLILAFDRANVPSILGAAIVLVAYSSAIVRMEFTYIAGYLAVAGLAVAYTAASDRRDHAWLLAGLLLLLAGLIRKFELLFVLAAMLPLYAPLLRSFKGRQRNRRFVMLLGCVGSLLLLCEVANILYYSSADWASYNDISSLRRQFGDYKLAKPIKAHPELLEGSNLTMNDIDLIHNRFYLDPTVFNSVNFDKVVSKISLPERVRYNVDSYRVFFHEFQAPQTRLFCGLLMLTVLTTRRRWAVVGSFALLLAAMAAVFAIGRPGVEYIYVPVFFGLVALPLLEPDSQLHVFARRLLMALATISLVVALDHARSIYAVSGYVHREAKLAQAEMCGLPDDKFRVVWGVKGVFPYDYTYRPFSPLGGDCGQPFYPIGGLELAAPVLAQFRAVTGKSGMVEALLSGQSFYIFASSGRLKLLKTFFQEHYNATLTTTLVSKGRSYTLHEMHLAKT